MTRKFVNGDIVKIEERFLVGNPNDKKLIGKYGKIVHIAKKNPPMNIFVKDLRKRMYF